ncbi:MAG: nicotinate (nicotinamide) nucleotide adenylyltransferase [Elusimicrobia bacterium]|nr:nicotinate (nicotinamide) nucleotide adenylyltransferase [Elusimicrobiota bacterium]
MIKPAEKILIFGGSFDPPHLGHVKLLSAAVKAIRPSAVYVFTAFHSPLKSASKTSFADRLAMARLAFSSIDGKIYIDDFEGRRNKKTFAWQIVKYVREKYPLAEIYFLMGSDCAKELLLWKKPQFLAQNARIVAGMRHRGENLSHIEKRFKLERLAGVFPDISSTDIRREVSLSGSSGKAVSPSAAGYINRKKLYGLNIHAWLKKNLSRERYAHTLSVAQLALVLAKKHGISQDKAVLAALLHDCAKGAAGLLHGHAGAHIAAKKFRIKDMEILSAIKHHTLGFPKMGKLAKIIYVADISAQGRGFKEAETIRATAFRDLDKALFLSVKAKLKHAINNGKRISYKLWNHLAK